MKILVISDSHGHVANLKTVMEIAKKSNMEAVIHCGDWDNTDAIKTVLDYEIPLYSVMGNADVDSDIEDLLRGECKKFDPFLLELEFDGRKVAVTHSVNFENKKLYDFKTVFSGHRHSKEQKMVNFTNFVRPGALINGINFAVYETITGELDFIENL